MWCLFLVQLLLTMTGEIRCGNAICDICNCSNSKDVYLVRCQNRYFSSVPRGWPQTVNTIRLDLSNNRISTLERLEPVRNKIELIVVNCGLKSIESGVFAHVPNIDLLDLSHNRIESEQLSADKFKGPFNDSSYEPLQLQHLNLSYNRIHTLPHNLFEHVPHLKTLNLQGNQMRVLDFSTQQSIANIKSLTNLNLARNGLTELLQTILEHHPIEILDLSFNRLDFVPQNLHKIGKTLEMLRLDSNPIIELNRNDFEGLLMLKQLFLNNLTVVTIGAEVFAPLERLSSVEISNNLQLESIQGVFEQKLRSINLSNNPKLRRLPVGLLNWTNLQEVHLGNFLDCSCDLYNISQQIPQLLKGQYVDCKGQSVPMANLDDFWCRKLTYNHFSIPLTALLVVVTTSGMLAVFLLRHRLKRRNTTSENVTFRYNLLREQSEV